MTPPKLDAGFVRMPEDEFEAMLARAAEQGARRALADVGLDGPEAAIDIHDLRTLLDSLRLARRTAWQTIVRLITTGLLLALIVNSAYRSPSYNRRVGGAKHSMHLQGAAFDISMANHDPESFEAEARDVDFTGFGFYPRQNFMHIDIGRARQWGDPFPPRATRSGRTTRFAPEPPRLRQSLTESRTMKGGGAAGVATIGAAGVEVVQQALADTQSAIQPLIPYLDILRWLFIAVALIGIGVTIYARWDDWRKGRR